VNGQQDKKRRVPTPLLALAPLALLGVLVAVFLKSDPTSVLNASFPPIEELAFQQITLEPGMITLRVTNDGPDPVTIAQVIVDDAYWGYTIEPDATIERLGSATVKIPYAWVQDDAHVIMLITSTGVTFEHEIGVAVESPRPSLELFGLFALLGIYVGVLPVALGLMWLPALRRTPKKWMDFFLFLTIGLLVFLGFDALEEALETVKVVPQIYQGMGLLVIGGFGSVALLSALNNTLAARTTDVDRGSMTLSYMIASGIGLHNLAEGLAIGAAYALGEIALGSMLVLGFMLHNITEGLAIVAPLAKSGAALGRLVSLGAIAGLPTIVGAWIGGFTYSPVWSLVFLAIGAGAIFQVAWQIFAQMTRRSQGMSARLDFSNFGGLMAGFLIMYTTGLLVAV
jgi:zinc transporter, ZIP family